LTEKLETVVFDETTFNQNALQSEVSNIIFSKYTTALWSLFVDHLQSSMVYNLEGICLYICTVWQKNNPRFILLWCLHNVDWFLQYLAQSIWRNMQHKSLIWLII